MADTRVRLFVPPGSCDRGVLELHGALAERLFAKGVRSDDQIVVLDGSGWAMTVELMVATRAECRGQVVERSVADERRTKITVHQGLLHPSDYRRLLVRATEAGVVAFAPIITDSSVVPALSASGKPEGEDEWPVLVRDAAEGAGRGRIPTIGQPLLFDRALEEAGLRGSVLLIDASGVTIDSLVGSRPFSIDLLCPPPSGFTVDELARARALEVVVVRPPYQGPDPIQPALTTIARLYDLLEDAEPA